MTTPARTGYSGHRFPAEIMPCHVAVFPLRLASNTN